VLDEVLGRPHDGSVPWVRASSQLTGDVHTAAAAFDGDPTTAWTTVRSAPERQWVEVNLTEPVTVDRVPLTVVADGLHSVPTEVEVSVDGEAVGRIPLPEITPGGRQNDTTVVDLPLPEPVTGSTFRFRLTGVQPVVTNDWVSDNEVDQPAAIAEIGLPGPTVPALPETFDTGCRTDLVTIDGEPLPVRVTGPTSELLAGRPLPLAVCGDAPVALDGGDHDIETALGRSTGLDIDQLVLRSEAGGAASPADAGTVVASAVSAGDGAVPVVEPAVEVVDQSHDRATLRVTGATPDEPFWLVLGQSHNLGWTATVDGDGDGAGDGAGDGGGLGEPELVDGFANGWRVTPSSESFEVELQFAPQQRVDVALVVSVIAALLCLALLVRRPRPLLHAPPSLAEAYSPVLAFRYEGALPTRRVAIWTGVGVGVLGLVVAGPGVGLVVGLAAGIGARHETFRRWLLLASPVALAVSAMYVVYLQVRWSVVPSFDWPIEMRRPHPLGWLAVMLLVADVIVDRMWQARRTDTD
jgi:arabinofuranan 3-O-arabinosyltransferase